MDEKKELVSSGGSNKQTYSNDLGNGLKKAEEAAEDEEVPGCRKYLMYSEPALFLAGLAVFAFVQLNQEYLYYRIEGSKEYPRWIQSILDGGGSTEDEGGCVSSSVNDTSSSIITNLETQISSESAYLSTKITLFRGIPPVFLTLIYCSYTDTVGRKFGLIVPAFGGLLNCVTYLLVEYTTAPLEWLYLGNFIEGISGGHLALVGSGFAYVFDTIKPGTVSFRFTLYQSVYFLASAVASLIIGYIIDGCGYIAAFWYLIACYGGIILYVAFILPESLPKKFRKPFNLKQVATNTIAGFAVFFRKRPNKTDRYSLIFIFIVAMIISIIATGNFNLQTVYAESPPFCLNSIQIGVLLAISSALTVVIPPVEIKLWGFCFRDEFFPFLCLTLQTFIFIFEGLADTATLLYIGKHENFLSIHTSHV